MAKPIGAQIISVCTALERLGPRTTQELAQYLGVKAYVLVKQACVRAAAHGFLTCDGDDYDVAAYWRDAVRWPIHPQKATWGERSTKELPPDVSRLMTMPSARRTLPALGVRNSIFDVRDFA